MLPALYGVIFTQDLEAAFSNWYMWGSLGVITVFAYSSEICTSVQLYVAIGVMCVGMVGYFMVEFLHHKQIKIAPTAVGKEIESNDNHIDRDTNENISIDKYYI